MNPEFRRTTTRLAAMAAISAMAIGLASCGGGGSSFVGIDRLGVSSGVITQKGSIFVNGVEWEISGSTSISVDDSPGSESELSIGQVVTVRGTIAGSGTTGTADSVAVDNSLEGLVESTNPAAGTFVVLGQTVLAGPDTQFDADIPAGADGQRGVADLQAGVDVVEVSGFLGTGNVLLATRVELSSATERELTGPVSNLGATTFTIGTQQVDFSAAGPVTLANGDVVEVKGSLSGDVLVATSVRVEDGVGGEDGDEGELEGLVTGFSRTSATVAGFTLDGTAVVTDSSTQYERGTGADLANNVRVEVEGEFDASGVLVADKIGFRVQNEEQDVEIVADVESVSGTTVTLRDLGIVVRTDAGTRYEDESEANVERFSLASLSPGDQVKVVGAADASTAQGNDVIATGIERRDRDTGDYALKAPIQQISGPTLVMLGVDVATDVAVFRDQDEQPIDATTFFSSIGQGSVVKAKTDIDGLIGNDTFVALEIELEDD
jgi:hypothetical protein